MQTTCRSAAEQNENDTEATDLMWVALLWGGGDGLAPLPRCMHDTTRGIQRHTFSSRQRS